MAKTCGNCIYHEKILNIETLLLCGLDGETVTPNTDGCYDWKKDDREDEREYINLGTKKLLINFQYKD